MIQFAQRQPINAVRVLWGEPFAKRFRIQYGKFDDPSVIANSAMAVAYFGEDIGAAIALVDRALALNPSFARGWYVSGILRLWAGEPDLTIEHVETSLRLNPRAQIPWSHGVIGAAHFVSQRLDQALPQLLLVTQEDPSHSEAHRYLAACYAHLGRLDDARETIRRLRATRVWTLARPELWRRAA